MKLYVLPPVTNAHGMALLRIAMKEALDCSVTKNPTDFEGTFVHVAGAELQDLRQLDVELGDLNTIDIVMLGVKITRERYDNLRKLAHSVELVLQPESGDQSLVGATGTHTNEGQIEAVTAWKLFFPKEEVPLVLTAMNRAKHDPNAYEQYRNLAAYAEFHGLDEVFWMNWFTGNFSGLTIEQQMHAGRSIRLFKEAQAVQLVKSAILTRIPNHRAVLIQASDFSTQLETEIRVRFTETGIALIYTILPSGMVQFWCFSLDGTDVQDTLNFMGGHGNGKRGWFVQDLKFLQTLYSVRVEEEVETLPY